MFSVNNLTSKYTGICLPPWPPLGGPNYADHTQRSLFLMFLFENFTFSTKISSSWTVRWDLPFSLGPHLGRLWAPLGGAGERKSFMQMGTFVFSSATGQNYIAITNRIRDSRVFSGGFGHHVVTLGNANPTCKGTFLGGRNRWNLSRQEAKQSRAEAS